MKEVKAEIVAEPMPRGPRVVLVRPQRMVVNVQQARGVDAPEAPPMGSLMAVGLAGLAIGYWLRGEVDHGH